MLSCPVCGNPIEDQKLCPYCSSHIHSGNQSKSPPVRYVVLNLEEGMPFVEEARLRMRREINELRSRGTKLIKIIHGYGSGGVGGKLRPALRTTLGKLRNQGSIEEYVPGEKFDRQSETGQRLLHDFPHLKRDPDTKRPNAGITWVRVN